MTPRLNELLFGENLKARVMRTSFWTVAGFGFSQGMRLLSNLVLTRILFPEAFGLMALVTVLMVGLTMFSDVGISPAIMQSKRGDDRDFLNTAFTIQIIRGVFLFVIGCALALPIANFYGEDTLLPMMMVASVQFMIAGFLPTRLETAKRHLLTGRITVLDAAGQILSLILVLGLALWTRSVWALVIGGLFSQAVQVVLYSVFLPGERNRLRWEIASVNELVNFGKWIFLSTAFGFFVAQGDRLILGKYLALDLFGIYSIGFFLGSFPLMLGMAVSGRLLIPVYRDRPPAASRENFVKMRKLRVTLTSSLFVLLGILAFSGPWLIALMYDDRYISAGAIVVLISCISLQAVIDMTYDSAALAAGKSKPFFYFIAIKAVLTILGLLIGVSNWGLAGALLGQFLGRLASYPALVFLARRLGVWDPLHDFGFAVIGAVIAASAIWWNWATVAMLIGG